MCARYRAILCTLMDSYLILMTLSLKLLLHHHCIGEEPELREVKRLGQSHTARIQTQTTGFRTRYWAFIAQVVPFNLHRNLMRCVILKLKFIEFKKLAYIGVSENRFKWRCSDPRGCPLSNITLFCNPFKLYWMEGINETVSSSVLLSCQEICCPF